MRVDFAELNAALGLPERENEKQNHFRKLRRYIRRSNQIKLSYKYFISHSVHNIMTIRNKMSSS